MNGNNVYIPHSQTESSTAIDPVFFENSMPQVETIQPRMVSKHYFIDRQILIIKIKFFFQNIFRY